MIDGAVNVQDGVAVVNVPDVASETAQSTAVQDQEQLLAMADNVD